MHYFPTGIVFNNILLDHRSLLTWGYVAELLSKQLNGEVLLIGAATAISCYLLLTSIYLHTAAKKIK